MKCYPKAGIYTRLAIHWKYNNYDDCDPECCHAQRTRVIREIAPHYVISMNGKTTLITWWNWKRQMPSWSLGERFGYLCNDSFHTHDQRWGVGKLQLFFGIKQWLGWKTIVSSLNLFVKLKKHKLIKIWAAMHQCTVGKNNNSFNRCKHDNTSVQRHGNYLFGGYMKSINYSHNHIVDPVVCEREIAKFLKCDIKHNGCARSIFIILCW